MVTKFSAGMKNRAGIDAASRAALARRVAESVADPELPMLTLADLGILRDVTVVDGQVTVSLTPTYSGCPALAQIRRDLAARLAGAGLPDAAVRTVLSPPWSSDWITAEGRRKLAVAGIAPPAGIARPAGPGQAGEPALTPVPLTLGPVRRNISCPRCGAAGTEQTAAFSGTACKDLYRCLACGEPFEHVKEI
jgi:ring-1,2-phenylacetyl-CoA epoxidase subunit PaaD